jgi:glycosyltransferase involved in cell wall biosynthesis
MSECAESTRPRVVVLIDWYLPGERSGGPVRTLHRLLQEFASVIDFTVLTRDRDVGDREPYGDVPTRQYVQADGARVRYLTPPERLPWRIVPTIRAIPHDTLYINSLFSGPFSIYPLAARRLGLLRSRRLVVAPRGQLNAGALALKARKKRNFLRVARAAGLYRDIVWQASTEAETAQIREHFGDGVSVVRAPNPDARHLAIDRDIRPRPGLLRVAFLSRISRMKNLLDAIEVIRRTRRRVEFDIYGPVEDRRYWRRCAAELEKLKPHIRARVLGAVPHDEVQAVLRQYDLLLLPTLGENHGHVIAEALAVGCRPLISDRTPWKGLAQHGVGWDLPLDDLDAFRDVVEGCADESPADRASAHRRASAWYAQHVDPEGVRRAHLALFGVHG